MTWMYTYSANRTESIHFVADITMGIHLEKEMKYCMLSDFWPVSLGHFSKYLINIDKDGKETDREEKGI